MWSDRNRGSLSAPLPPENATSSKMMRGKQQQIIKINTATNLEKPYILTCFCIFKHNVLTVLRKEVEVQGRNVVLGVVHTRGWNSCIAFHCWRGETPHCKHILHTLFFQVWQRCIKTQGSSLQTSCFSRWWPARASLVLSSCLLPLPSPFLGLQQVPAVPMEHPWAQPLTGSAQTAFGIQVADDSKNLLKPCCDSAGSLLSELSVFTVTYYYHLLFSC